MKGGKYPFLFLEGRDKTALKVVEMLLVLYCIQDGTELQEEL